MESLVIFEAGGLTLFQDSVSLSVIVCALSQCWHDSSGHGWELYFDTRLDRFSAGWLM